MHRCYTYTHIDMLMPTVIYINAHRYMHPETRDVRIQDPFVSTN